MLIDSATIDVRSGKGGHGAVSFRRQKYIPKGGPDGGDGGDGGDVIFYADAGVNTLLGFAGRHHWHATDGEPGRAKQQHGANGHDLTVHLPVGTLIHDEQTGELRTDLDMPGESVVIARGGRGGWGNEHFKTATHQTPIESTAGEPAVELHLRLELKLMAEVGLIGKPNAGKSTLLARISRARPKIADYPFTTLEPQLGIARLAGESNSGGAVGGEGGDGARRLVVADIPGLIDKAHEGSGLGTRFLRHIERTRLLVHVIEPDPMDGSDPTENYRIIRDELANYSPALAAKPEVIALSKMDVLGDQADQAAVELIQEALGKPVIPISSASGRGVTELLEACWQRLDRAGTTAGGWQKNRSGRVTA